MALAGTRRPQKTTIALDPRKEMSFDAFEDLALNHPTEFKAFMDANPLAATIMLERLMALSPELVKKLVASGEIKPELLTVAERRLAEGKSPDDVAKAWAYKDEIANNPSDVQNNSSSSPSKGFGEIVISTISSVASAVWEPIASFALSMYERSGAKGLVQGITNVFTQTIPNFFTKTVPDLVRRGWNKIISVKDSVVDATKSFGHSAVRVAKAAYNKVIDPYIVQPVVAVARAVMSPVQTAKNIYHASRDWVAGLVSGPRVAAATVAAVAVMGVTPAVAYVVPQKAPIAATPQSRNVPRNRNFAAMRAEARVTPEALKPQAAPAPVKPAQTGCRPGLAELKVTFAGGPLGKAASPSPQVAANATPPEPTPHKVIPHVRRGFSPNAG